MRTNRVFSDDELKTLKQMRAAGKGPREIAEAIGKTNQQVSNKIQRMMRKIEPVKTVKKAYKLKKFKTKTAGEVVLPVAQHKKPMIVFVGEAGEITVAIKELFS